MFFIVKALSHTLRHTLKYWEAKCWLIPLQSITGWAEVIFSWGTLENSEKWDFQTLWGSYSPPSPIFPLYYVQCFIMGSKFQIWNFKIYIRFDFLQITHTVMLSKNLNGQTLMTLIEVNRESLSESLPIGKKNDIIWYKILWCLIISYTYIFKI